MEIMLLVAAMVCVGWVLIVSSVIKAFRKQAQTKKALRERGITTTADVIQRVHTSRSSFKADGSRTRSNSYAAIVRFMANDTEYERKVYTGYNTYKLFENATRIDVVYLPEQPEEVWFKNDL